MLVSEVKEQFIRIPPGLDCRELGRRAPKPQPREPAAGMTFGKKLFEEGLNA